MKTTFILVFAFTLSMTNCKEMPETDDITTIDSEEDIVRDSVNSDIIENDPMVDMKKENQKSYLEQKQELTEQGFQVMEMVDEETQDTILMQQYFMVFLKSGPVRNQNEEEAKRLQVEHMAHLSKMYEMGYADISGPFGDDGDIRGITIYNVPTMKIADSLANADPMVRAQRLVIEIHPWWAMKTAKLR